MRVGGHVEKDLVSALITLQQRRRLFETTKRKRRNALTERSDRDATAKASKLTRGSGLPSPVSETVKRGLHRPL